MIGVPPVADPAEMQSRLREVARRFDILRIKGFLSGSSTITTAPGTLAKTGGAISS